MEIFNPFVNLITLPTRWLGLLIGQIILPAQYQKKDVDVDDKRNTYMEEFQVNITQAVITTEDKAHLMVYKIQPTQAHYEEEQAVDHRDIQASIHFQPNAACARETFYHLAKLANKTGVTFYTADYRSVNSSQKLNQDSRIKQHSFSMRDMEQDAKAIFRHVTETEGFPSGNVELSGMSLGGSIACRLAHHLQNTTKDKNDLPWLSADFTFSSLTAVVAGYLIGSSTNHRYGYLDPRKHYFGVTTPWAYAYEWPFKLAHAAVALPLIAVTKAVLTVTNWENSSSYQYAQYPIQKRYHTQIRTWREQREQITDEYKDDRVIRQVGQLSNSLFVRFSRWSHRRKLSSQPDSTPSAGYESPKRPARKEITHDNDSTSLIQNSLSRDTQELEKYRRKISKFTVDPTITHHVNNRFIHAQDVDGHNQVHPQSLINRQSTPSGQDGRETKFTDYLQHTINRINHTNGNSSRKIHYYAP